MTRADWSQVAELLVITQGKGAVLLLAVSMAVLLFGRSSAAARHLLWLLGMAGVLALPVLGVALPRWQVEVPEWIDARMRASHEPRVAVGGTVADEAFVGVATPAPTPAAAALPHAARSAPTAPAEHASETSRTAPAPAAVVSSRVRAPAPEPATSATVWAAALLVGIWGFGAALLLGSLAASLLAVRRLSIRSFDFPRGRVTELADRMRLGMGIEAPVRIVRGEPGAMPMSWGLLRPVVLLPEGAERWHNSRLVSVLLHELSHVKRRDCSSQVLAEIALALHWLNPLAWLAVRRLRVEREHACDDAVVAAGARPSEYAEELISLARGFQTVPGSSMAAVAMARPVHLAGRIRALLHERRARGLSAAGALACAGLAIGVSAAVASLSPTSARTNSPLPSVLPASAPSPLPHIAPPNAVRDALAPPTPVALPAALADAPRATAPEVAPPEPRWQVLIPSGLAALVSMRLPVRQEATCGMATSGWERNTVNSNDDEHRLTWSRPGCDVEVRVEGDVEFTADFRDVARLGPDALLRIEEEDARTERRLDVTPGAGGRPSYLYRLDGREQPFDDAARAWYEGMLLQVFRRGGFMAEERVAALLRGGGVAAVLQELDALQSDHVFALYTRELLEQADVSAQQAVDLLSRARARVDSDYYVAQILGAVADRHLGSDAVLEAFLATSGTIESDHYRAEVLGRALRVQDLGFARIAQVLRSASEIGSDHYKAELLERVASRYALEPELRQVYLQAVGSIDSDHYRSEVLSTLLARNDLDAGELSVVLEAANGVGSDHYRAQILERVAGRALPSDPLRAAYLEAAAGIQSEHYRSVALSHLLQRETLTPAQLQELIRAAAAIESDHYKAELLVDVLQRHRPQGAARDTFLEAMESIGSSHYRGEVAQALLRSDRGGA